MKRRVHKYPLVIDGKATIESPFGARLVHIDVQDNKPFIWLEVNEDNRPSKRYFHSVPTGALIPDNTGKCHGTYQWDQYGKTMVCHVYEEYTSENALVME